MRFLARNGSNPRRNIGDYGSQGTWDLLHDWIDLGILEVKRFKYRYLEAKIGLFQFGTTIRACCLVVLGSAVHAIIIDVLFSGGWGRSKKAPCVKPHFSHLFLTDKVINAQEHPYYGNNVKWKWKNISKGEADCNRDSYPNQLNLQKSFSACVQRLSYALPLKRVFAILTFTPLL